LDAGLVLQGILREVQSYEATLKIKPLDFGRAKQVKGIAFEAEVEPAYKAKGFETT